MPVDPAHLALWADHTGRPHIAHPGIVALETYDTNTRLEQAPRLVELRSTHADRYRFELRDRMGHRCECPLRGFRVFAPVIRPRGPQHPAAPMRLELRGHSESVGQRR